MSELQAFSFANFSKNVFCKWGRRRSRNKGGCIMHFNCKNLTRKKTFLLHMLIQLIQYEVNEEDFFEKILFGKKEMNFKTHWSRMRLKIFNLSKIKLRYLLLKKLLKFLDHRFGCWDSKPKYFKVAVMTPLKVTITFIIFWHFLRFYQILLSPQLKRSAIISYKNGIYELPNGLWLKDFRKLGNARKI